MTKFVKHRKFNIALIVISGVVFIISVLLLISSSRYLANMLRSYPVPIDSFGTIDLGITFVLIFSILVISSAIGIIVGALNFKRQ